MYEPPTVREYPYISPGLLKDYKFYYDLGYNDAKNAMEYKNPFEPSGHERDTTHTDELNYYYYSGFYAYEKTSC